MKRVLLTGGAGMIGRRVVAQLQQRDIEVAVIDNLSSGLAMPDHLALASTQDIRDMDALTTLCRDFRPDSIVHLAAMHHIPTCETRRTECLDINVLGTENVLHAAGEAGVERLVIGSSGAVYAWADGALTEDSCTTGARDNYALSKLCNESQLRFWSERRGAIGRVARLFNTIANDDPNAHLIPDILERAIVRLGNLASKRDYIHAEDAAAGLLAVLNDPRTNVPFDVFNVCSGSEHSVEDVVREIAGALNRSVRIDVDDSRKRRADRPSQLGDTTKTARLLGWVARLRLPEAVTKVLSLP
jgi:UDP-glucose 4-epimerase